LWSDHERVVELDANSLKLPLQRAENPVTGHCSHEAARSRTLLGCWISGGAYPVEFMTRSMTRSRSGPLALFATGSSALIPFDRVTKDFKLDLPDSYFDGVWRR
jgi:hypothetical protein